MNQMEIFKNPEFGAIRAVEIDGEPWLVGKDVSLALGYTNPQKAIRDHVDAEDRTVNDSFTVNGTAITLINESGLYSLVLSSMQSPPTTACSVSKTTATTDTSAPTRW